MNASLLSISPLDGRYGPRVKDLHQYFSEAALMRYRILIEIEWFIFLVNELELIKKIEKSSENEISLDSHDLRFLRGIYENFDLEAAERVKSIEKTTNHDVKAIEYYIKEVIEESKAAKGSGGSEKPKNSSDYDSSKISKYSEFIHFSCTSEDINNLSYSCMIRDFLEREFYPIVGKLVEDLYGLAQEYKGLPMLSRTHGQTASPTTLGKELINVVARLERELMILSEGDYLMGKINGAVGNYNAHFATYREIDWINASKDFIESLGLKPNLYTTQIEPHDCFADVFDGIKRINNIILDLDRDMWSYISRAYFGQKVVKGEVGSSTMPHKVNPIDFENSEGNLGLANALLEHMSAKLPISRLQRDLSDSTVARNIGSAFGYCILAYKSTLKGLSKCKVNKELILDDLSERWEVLAEPIQMVMRKNLISGAYEKLKALTRGEEGITEKKVRDFVKSLGIKDSKKTSKENEGKISKEDYDYLMKLKPETYTGLAEKLVEDYKLKFAGSDGGCGPSGCSGCQGCG